MTVAVNERRTMIDQQLRAAWRFFHDQAGYSVPPGRAACALELARAEQQGQEEGLTFEWMSDYEAWDGDVPEPDHLLSCLCRGSDGLVLTSLCGIGVNSLDDPYLRVVQAELAMEALDEIFDREASRVLSL